MATVGRNRVGESAWASLRRFQNPAFVARYLQDLHGLPDSQKSNAQKQASQVRYSLQQAKEYFDAGEVATLATQPNLMYYCTMSLVLAEILVKQSGDSSLDRARAQHRHHGLEFRCDGRWQRGRSLREAAQNLRAMPLLRPNGEGFGTFELWHRTAREDPLGGNVTQVVNLAGGTTSGFRCLLTPLDERLARLPGEGITLLDCLQALSRIDLAYLGVQKATVRATLSANVQTMPNNQSDYTLIIHPGNNDLIAEFLDNIIFYPSAVDQVSFNEFPSGGILNWHNDGMSTLVFRSAPHGYMLHAGEVRFWPQNRPLNEFGYLYVAMFLAGNYARYYPDWWLRDIEEASPLALAIEQLLRIAGEQIPLSTLSELSRTSFVREAP